jgi:putative ABC transport system permease protein
VWIFGKEFSVIILASFLIAAPFAWWLMSSWLQDFEYRIPLGPSAFVLAMLLIVLIVSMTIGYQTLKAAFTNPVKSLRTE